MFSGTSFSSAIVTAIASLAIGYMKEKEVPIRVGELKSLLMLSTNKLNDVDEMIQGAGELSPNLLLYNIQNNITESLYPTSAMPIRIESVQLYYQKTPSFIGAIGFSEKEPTVVVGDSYTSSCMSINIILNKSPAINIYYIGLNISWNCNINNSDEAQLKLLLGIVLTSYRARLHFLLK